MAIERVRAQHEADLAAQALYDEARRTAGADAAAQASDPFAAMLEAQQDALMWHRVCRTMVGTLEQIRYSSKSAGEQLDARVALFERSMERVATISERMVRLGIDERMTKISDTQNARIAGAIESAVLELAQQLGFDPKSDLVRSVLGKHLRAVTA